MRRLLIALFLLLSANYAAAEHVNDEMTNSDDFQWQLMIEVALEYNPTILETAELDGFYNFIGVGLYLDLSYKDFFIQTNRHRTNTLAGEFGYRLVEQHDWGIDLIGTFYFIGFDPEAIDRYNDKKTPGFAKLDERNPGGGLALRYSYFTEDVLFTADLASLQGSLDNNSWLIDLYYSHRSGYKNWDFYSGVGFTYYSADIVNYYGGVTPDESSVNMPVYQADDGIKVEAQIFGLYPLSKNWTFSTGITQTYYSSSFSDSPVGLRQHITMAKAGLRYVF